jgi:hypothetical protein
MSRDDYVFDHLMRGLGQLHVNVRLPASAVPSQNELLQRALPKGFSVVSMNGAMKPDGDIWIIFPLATPGQIVAGELGSESTVRLSWPRGWVDPSQIEALWRGASPFVPYGNQQAVIIMNEVGDRFAINAIINVSLVGGPTYLLLAWEAQAKLAEAKK